jgi:hypothetical protein
MEGLLKKRTRSAATPDGATLLRANLKLIHIGLREGKWKDDAYAIAAMARSLRPKFGRL